MKKLYWLCLFLCSTLFAQDGFLIETIEFRGLKTNSESVLRLALLLEEGQVYNEDQLRSAQYRLDSLRFVYHSDLALRRGSKRGAYKLEITIEETRRYFWALDSELLAFTTDDQLRDDANITVDPDTGTQLSGFAFGRRWFPGKNGELTLFFPFSPGIAYSHYNLFNRRIVASLAVQDGGFGKNFSAHPELDALSAVETKDAFGVTFSMGGLINQNQWLNFNYKLNTGIIESTDPIGHPEQVHEDTNFRNHKSELVWRWDKRDHPLFPVNGFLVKSGLFLDREYRDVANDDPLVPYERMRVNNFHYYLEAEKYWERSNDQTLALGFLARSGYHKIAVRERAGHMVTTYPDYDSSKVRLKGLYARNLLQRKLWGKERDFRMEAEFTMEVNRSSLENVFPDPDFERFKARFSIVGRDNFGFLRFSVVYRSTNEELWQ